MPNVLCNNYFTQNNTKLFYGSINFNFSLLHTLSDRFESCHYNFKSNTLYFCAFIVGCYIIIFIYF